MEREKTFHFVWILVCFWVKLCIYKWTNSECWKYRTWRPGKGLPWDTGHNASNTGLSVLYGTGVNPNLSERRVHLDSWQPLTSLWLVSSVVPIKTGAHFRLISCMKFPNSHVWNSQFPIQSLTLKIIVQDVDDLAENWQPKVHATCVQKLAFLDPTVSTSYRTFDEERMDAHTSCWHTPFLRRRISVMTHTHTSITNIHTHNTHTHLQYTHTHINTITSLKACIIYIVLWQDSTLILICH